MISHQTMIVLTKATTAGTATTPTTTAGTMKAKAAY
jgi:hypothetical protein